MENFGNEDTLLSIYIHITSIMTFKDKLRPDIAFLKKTALCHGCKIIMNCSCYLKIKWFHIQYTHKYSTNHHKLPSFNLSYDTFHIQIFYVTPDSSVVTFFEQHSLLQEMLHCIYYKTH